jgi:diacylglycerol kinase
MLIPKKHHTSFKNAKSGILVAFRTQTNFRIHLIFSFLAIVLGLIFGLNSTEWAIISLVIAVGLVIELLNTAIEFTVDLLTQEYKLLAQFAKDTSAGAMLIYALFSIIIAAVIFLPRIFS